MTMPSEYVGREQSYLKHRVLEKYLVAWAQKRASNAKFRRVELVYVDCFAGPWQSKDQELKDTSVFIGLKALESAAARWGSGVTAKAVFVEQDDAAFVTLKAYLEGRDGVVRSVPIHGAFEQVVGQIEAQIGAGSAFLFVDPTGWKGVAMQAIAPLVRRHDRDVLINLMYNHVNRFKDDQRDFLREQMAALFGMDDAEIPPGLNEEGLLALYRSRLKELGGLPHAADLAILHPTSNRTWFHLVVGGHHPIVLELFRQVERQVCGDEAESVRAGARTRKAGQEEMLFGDEPVFAGKQRLALARLHDELRSRAPGTRLDFQRLWTEVLESYPVERTNVVAVVRELERAGVVEVVGEGQRTIGNGAFVTWRGAASG